MAYATQADMLARFGEDELIQLTDRADPPIGAIDAAVLAARLADADALIDGYLAGRYSLPLASTPAILTQYACDVARYLLYGNKMPEDVRDRYEDALRFLGRVADGRIGLGVTPAPAAGGPAHAAGARVFDTAGLEGF